MLDIRKHKAPIHPGTGTDQSVHGGSSPTYLWEDAPSDIRGFMSEAVAIYDQRWPGLLDGVEVQKAGDEKGPHASTRLGSSAAFVSRGGDTIFLNTEAIDRMIRGSERWAHHPFGGGAATGIKAFGFDDPQVGIIAHELAHILESRLSPDITDELFSFIPEQVPLKDQEFFDSDLFSPGRDPSIYAMMNRHEYFAEAMVDYLTSPSPARVSLAIGDRLSEYLAPGFDLQESYKDLDEFAEEIASYSPLAVEDIRAKLEEHYNPRQTPLIVIRD